MPTEEPAITAVEECEPLARRIPEVMDEGEVCELLSISPATAWRLRKANRLGHCKYGAKIKYLRRHIVAFLDAHEVAAEEQQQERGETRLRAVG